MHDSQHGQQAQRQAQRDQARDEAIHVDRYSGKKEKAH
jgi:hypothetical protein